MVILALALVISVFGFAFDPMLKVPVVYGFGMGLFYGNYFYLMPRLYFEGRYLRYFLASIVFVTAIILMRYYVEEVLLSAYINISLLDNDGLVGLRYVVSSVSFFLLAFVFRMATNWMRRETEEYQLKALKNETELKMLKNQLRPHFLFNSINNVYSIAIEHKDATAALLLEISQMLRYLIYKTEKDSILVEEEVHFLNTLIKLYSLRYDAIPFHEVKVVGSIAGYKIPPLVLLPFIENLFKHGDFEQQQATWLLRLSIDGDKLDFETQNPISSASTDKEAQSGIGLENVQRRLEMLYPGGYQLTTESKGDVYRAILTIDLNER